MFENDVIREHAGTLDAQVLASIQPYLLRARRVVEGLLAGTHRSAHLGMAIDFAQHRPYSPGDDPRHVDWKVFGRTDKLYVKQYEDETNVSCTMVVDATGSMAYRGQSSPASKYQYAVQVAASLAWLLRRQGDAVGLELIGGDQPQSIMAAATDGQLDRILQLLTSTEPRALSGHDGGVGGRLRRADAAATAARGEVSIGGPLRLLAARLKRRGLVVIISDMYDRLETLLDGLTCLSASGQEVIVFQVCDPDEIDFPGTSVVRLDDLESDQFVTVDPVSLRDGYRQSYQRYHDRLRRACWHSGIDLTRVRTDQSLRYVLPAYLSSREHRR